MFATITLIIVYCLAVVEGVRISATPHVEYSSSVGVLGCKINTSRVAYWPGNVGCDDICVRVTHVDSGRALNLLRVDQSTSAYDISYDAWNYLSFGKYATESPQRGGGVAMTYDKVHASNCVDLIHTNSKKLPLTAANSINYIASCLSQPSSWIAKNYELYNILDPVCKWGFDEVCSFDFNTSNQPTCPHTLGLAKPLDRPVINIEYGTGRQMPA